MASIRNRRGVWQARINRKVIPTITKSFHTKQDAENGQEVLSQALAVAPTQNI